MPTINRASFNAGLRHVWIEANPAPTIRPPEPPAEDMELLSVRVMRTYGSDGYIKRFELIFATRTVEIEVSNPEHCWRGFDFAASADLLANLFLLALKRPIEVISARDEDRLYQARIAPQEQEVAYASGGTVTINGGSLAYVNGNDYVLAHHPIPDVQSVRWTQTRNPDTEQTWTLYAVDRPDGT